LAEPSSTLERLKQEALKAVAEFMATRPETTKLDGGGLRRGEVAGWRTRLSVAEQTVPVRIALDTDFPFSAPRFYLEDGPFFLRYPHVDEHEKLCLNPSTTTYSPARPLEVLQACMADAEQLLTECASGHNRDDFAREFHNYWIEFRKNDESPIWSLLRSYDRTRLVYYWAGKNFRLVGESPEEISAWLGCAFPNDAVAKRTFYGTVFIALPKPLFPEDYPRTNGDFRRLALQADATVDHLLAKVAPQENRSLCVMFGFASPTGPVLGGLRLSEPVVPNASNWMKSRPVKADGFRPGSMPEAALLGRFYSNATAIPLAVQRVDSPWLLRRGSAGFDDRLAGKSIGIVGCGSLGAEIAVQLAKSGVGRFFLIDNQPFSWDNVGRHVLPGRFAGMAKDDALKGFLGEQMPSLVIETGGGWDAQKVLREKRGFAELDLIVSTTGDWAVESYLNATARTARIFPPVVFGWTEPYGYAGHALAVMSQGGCLACGCSDTGLFEARVTSWPPKHPLIVQAAGCGDLFQPYGTVDVTPIRALISELSLRVLRHEVKTSTLWTWVGDIGRLQSAGAALAESWQKALPVAAGWCRCERDWTATAECPLCRR
jgi:hypothetical protein